MMRRVMWTRCVAVSIAVVFLCGMSTWGVALGQPLTKASAGFDMSSAVVSESLYNEANDIYDDDLTNLPYDSDDYDDSQQTTMSWDEVTSGPEVPTLASADQAPTPYYQRSSSKPTSKTHGMRIAIMPVNVGLARVPNSMLKELYRTMDCSPSPGYETCAVGY